MYHCRLLASLQQQKIANEKEFLEAQKKGKKTLAAYERKRAAEALAEAKRDEAFKKEEAERQRVIDVRPLSHYR